MSCRLNVILDLDNTLINTIENPALYNQVPENSGLQSKFINVEGRIMKTYKRPYLDQFLDYLFQNFNVGVLTAGTKPYAQQIVWNFIQNVPNRKVDFLLSRGDVEYAHRTYGGNKNLKLIWDALDTYDYYPCNTILIDDHPEVHKTNNENTIKIEPWNVTKEGVFNINSSDDKVLLKVITMLKTINDRYLKGDCTLERKNTRCYNTDIDLFYIYPEAPQIIGNREPRVPSLSSIFNIPSSSSSSSSLPPISPFRTIPSQESAIIRPTALRPSQSYTDLSSFLIKEGYSNQQTGYWHID